MRRGWKAAVAVGALLSIPRCSCGSNDDEPDCAAKSAPHATFVETSGFCGGDYCELQCDQGFANCDNDSNNGCETSTDLSALHEVVIGDPWSGGGGGCGSGGGAQIGTIGSCAVDCEIGWLDCDHLTANGCETQGTSCFQPPAKDGSTLPAPIASLSGVPRGLAACAGAYYVLSGTEVVRVDATTLVVTTVATSPGAPAGGLACDGAALYWTTLADADAGAPNGELVTVDLATSTLDAIAGGLDPGPGVAVRGSTVYFVARSGFADAGEALAAASLDDGGVVPWMPVGETGTYAPFALAPNADWSLAAGIVYRRADGGATAWIDAGSATALVTAASGDPFAILPSTEDGGSDAGDAGDGGSDDAASDADAGTDADADADAGDAEADAAPALPGDTFASLLDDAGNASLTPTGATVEHVLASASQPIVLVAGRSTVYEVALPDGGAKPVATTAAPVAYVDADASWVVWVTLATTSSSAGLWRAPRVP